MKIHAPLPSMERVNELLDYCPRTGVFTWKVDRGGKAKAGTIAGSLRGDGYRAICIDLKSYQAARLAWLITHKQDPKNMEIDHIDGDIKNNSISNLRIVSRLENCLNRKRRSDNKSGKKGVYKYRGKWIASITYKGKRTFLGAFDTAENASAVYDKAALALHGQHASTNTMPRSTR